MRMSRFAALWMPISDLLVLNILTGQKRAMTELKFDDRPTVQKLFWTLRFTH